MFKYLLALVRGRSLLRLRPSLLESFVLVQVVAVVVEQVMLMDKFAVADREVVVELLLKKF
jgi:hypothetical protein